MCDNDSDTGGVDYGEVQSTFEALEITFGGNRHRREATQDNSTACIIVPLVADSLVESDEFFTVELSTLDDNVFLVSQNVTVTIEDNDGKL